MAASAQYLGDDDCDVGPDTFEVNKELLTMLCDPISKAPLGLEIDRLDKRGRVESGTLLSPDGTHYPIRDGIPRFLPQSDTSVGVKSFEEEWNHFNYTDYKPDWLAHAVGNTFGSADVFRDKFIVDAGGGSGAQTLWMLESGAKHVVMLELSDTVDDVVQRNLEPSGFSNYDVVQCSIDDLPLKPDSINGIVFCHNVIQHTPSVERTASALFGIVKSGGEFVFNCYPQNDTSPLRWLRFHLIYSPLRWCLSRMPFRVILGYARLMGVLRQVPLLGYVLEKAGFCMQGDVPTRKGEGRWQRIKRKFRTTTLITFDWYGAHAYQHHKSDEEIRALISKLQPDPDKIRNVEKYFSRPKPIGCALRISK